MSNNKINAMKKRLSMLPLLSLALVLLLGFGCKKATIPELTTVLVTDITINSAISGGNIISDGGEAITEKGVCWSTQTNPTIADSKTSDGDGAANFTSNLVGLTEGTTYYVRAYATNNVGTAYGNELSFTTNQITGAVLTTTEATNLTSATAASGGNITSAGGGIITARGVCWSTSQNPTTSDNKTTDGAGDGLFTANITGLTDGTVYYYRAYATNSFGTTYGEEYSFITPVTDIQGNVYKTIKIGTQIWMAENLKTTKLNNDTEIANVISAVEWASTQTPALAWYNNDDEYYRPKYGALYNWFTVNSGNLCPQGWHVPTDAEVITLEQFLGMTQEQASGLGDRGTDEGAKMKSTTGWNAGENGTNTSGFTALPGGYRYYNDGAFYGETTIGYWWTATEFDATIAWYRRLDGDKSSIHKGSTDKRAGKSVRCIKD